MPAVLGIDHIYLAVQDLERAERFYDRVMLGILGFRKSRFTLESDPHVHYFNRHFGFVLRPAAAAARPEACAAGLHHLCFRVADVAAVTAVAAQLRAAGLPATEAEHHPEYAEDYWAVYFSDPDGTRLEVTNYRRERRERHERWEEAGG
jgi:catechol 2,3-dioxygenase-like lactoylglutathione lyase family enzyme